MKFLKYVRGKMAFNFMHGFGAVTKKKKSINSEFRAGSLQHAIRPLLMLGAFVNKKVL